MADNIVLIGQKELLTDRFILSLGSGKNEPIDKLLNDVDIATEVWGAADFESVPANGKDLEHFPYYCAVYPQWRK